MRRRTVRRKVVQALYELEFQPDAIDRILDAQSRKLSPDDFAFFQRMIQGVYHDHLEIDRIISNYLKSGWSIDRISVMERTILRFAVYELLYHREAPPKVIINEAIELAKQFGDENSRRFINGVLGKLLRETTEQNEE